MENTESTTVNTSNTSIKEDGKTMAIIAYITIIGLIIAFVMNNEKKNQFTSYHIRQSLGVALVALALSLINVIPILGWIISFLGFFVILFLWIMGLVNAINVKEIPVPILGKKFEEWFKNI